MITRLCQSCAQEIPAIRLEARPSASLCITCQTKSEEDNKPKQASTARLESFLARCAPGEFKALLDYGSKKADSQ